MYNIADKMITGCKFDFAIFAIFAILTLQIPIACFDMLRSWHKHCADDSHQQYSNTS